MVKSILGMGALGLRLFDNAPNTKRYAFYRLDGGTSDRHGTHRPFPTPAEQKEKREAKQNRKLLKRALKSSKIRGCKAGLRKKTLELLSHAN